MLIMGAIFRYKKKGINYTLEELQLKILEDDSVLPQAYNHLGIGFASFKGN